ncbi:BnaC01g30590D [Brassica napus]|uniref:(rape) hypothetical protein n=1 Tax=Brassica napus TaxID=3708 RepID=A0A078F7F4_BRANA|nr:unnamed protein product [Brassica napus]CDY09032.1 BnaC01g30590D [Brassica napus]
MFPKWEFDVEDTPAENIIKLMFLAVVSPAKKKVVKEDSPRPRKKAPSEEAAAVASEEVTTTVAVEKKVGITTKRKGTSSENTTSPPKPTLEPGSESVNGKNAGKKSLAEDKGPDVPATVPADASSSKDKAPEPSLEDARYQEKRDAALALSISLYGKHHSKSDHSKQKLYPGYNLFAPIDKKKLKELADWLKTCPHYRTPLDKKPQWLEDCHIDAWINVLRKRYDANPQYFRSERMCFLDHLFAQQWRFNFKDFKDSEPDQNDLGRRLPGGAWNYYAGTIPSFCQSNKSVVFDSICSSISPKELDVYIECHALGIHFSKKDFAKANGKTMRDKMAVDIFQELPDAHEFENKDNDANLGAYEGRLTVKSSGMLDDLTISSM